jgi:cystathionine beta-lyase/cystathionine gamma-synthase
MPGVAYRAELAADFAGHPALSVVLYPGLPVHPGHQIAAR